MNANYVKKISPEDDDTCNKEAATDYNQRLSTKPVRYNDSCCTYRHQSKIDSGQPVAVQVINHWHRLVAQLVAVAVDPDDERHDMIQRGACPKNIA